MGLSAFCFVLSFGYCMCIESFTTYDNEVNPEPATFGMSTREDEFPFMTALGWINATGGVNFLCGGMLISPSFVLTAAHCVFVEGRLPNLIKIGGNRLNSTHNEDHLLRAYLLHPWYDDTQAYNDVALLQLQRPSKKEPVCLWSRPTPTSARVTAIGYGATQFAGSGTPVLQKVSLIIVETRFCRVYHERKRKFIFGVSNDHLCAGDPAGRQDTCQGDSGGPLLLKSDIKQYAIGIISTGQACFGFPPSIYTKISSFIDWIEFNVHLNEQNIWEPQTCK